MKPYEEKEVDEITDFIKLHSLPDDITKYREISIKNRDLPTDLPPGIQFFIRSMTSVKDVWISNGWVNEQPRLKGLVPIGLGAIEESTYLFVREYVRAVELSREYPEFSRLPPNFDNDYEAAKQALEGVNHADCPKDLTLDTITYIAFLSECAGHK